MPVDAAAPSMVMVVGVTGAGKSYFINQLAGREIVKEGPDLDPCTEECQLVPVTIGKSKVLLVDTPGFDDTVRTDAEILSEIARVLAAQYELGVQLKGVIYIHRITDIKYGRSSVKTFETFRKICGESALSNVLLITSRWSEVDPAVGAERERQLKEKFWAYMLARGSNISRFHGDRPSAIGLISQLIKRDTVVLDLQKELVDEGKSLDETVAGAYVSDNLEKLKLQYEEELASLERLKQDLRENDREMRVQFQRDWAVESARLQEVQNQQVNLQRPVGAEVQEEIKRKGSGLSKVLPFLPVAISVLAAIVGVPPGVTELFTGWFADFGGSSDTSI